MSLKKQKAEIIPKPGKPVDFPRIRQLVEKAGQKVGAVRIEAEGILLRQGFSFFFVVSGSEQRLSLAQNEVLHELLADPHSRGPSPLSVRGHFEFAGEKEPPLTLDAFSFKP